MSTKRVGNHRLRWLSRVGAALLALVAFSLCFASSRGLAKLQQRKAALPDMSVSRAQDRIRRGEAIAASFCSFCHSRFGILSGGPDVGQEISPNIGRFVPPNLTPGGPLRRWTDGQIFRAIRNGIGADGNWLIIMSYTNVGKLSDADIRSLIAYMRTVPAAARTSVDPPDRLNLVGLVLLGVGLLPTGDRVFSGQITAPAKAPTAEYGEYILSYQDCRSCHGADLHGGKAGQLAPVAPPLDVVVDWTREEFVTTLRTGVDPFGRRLDTQKMPWDYIGRMDYDELTAIYAYLKTHL